MVVRIEIRKTIEAKSKEKGRGVVNGMAKHRLYVHSRRRRAITDKDVLSNAFCTGWRVVFAPSQHSIPLQDAQKRNNRFYPQHSSLNSLLSHLQRSFKRSIPPNEPTSMHKNAPRNPTNIAQLLIPHTSPRFWQSLAILK